MVAVTWNARDAVLACLASVEPAVVDGVADVIVVDNASTDGTATAVAQGAPWARVIANRRNRGLAAANNQGIAASGSPYVLLTNPAVVFSPDAIGALRAAMDRRPAAAFVFPRLVHPSGALQTSTGDLPTVTDAVLGRQVARRRGGDRTGFWWDGWPHDEPARVGHGLEACYLVRREAVAEIGVLDERYWLDWEGIDWCARAAAIGWESWFEPTAQVTHIGGVSLRQAPTRWIVQSHRSMYRYFADRLPGWARPGLVAVFGARCLAKLAAARGAGSYGRSHPGSGSEHG